MHLIGKPGGRAFAFVMLVTIGCASGSGAAATGGAAAPANARPAGGGRPGTASAPSSAPAGAPTGNVTPAPAGLDSAALVVAIRGILDSLPAQTALHAKHLATGREIAIRADVPMNTASVIKIPIMVLAYRDVEAGGALILEARRIIGPDDLRRGSGLLQTFDIGLNPTWRDLITQMIITSDNTATDILIAKVGRDRVNRMLDSLGYKQTLLLNTTARVFRAAWEAVDTTFAALSDREVFERGFPSDTGAPRRMAVLVADPNRWLGRTTARESSRLLEQLERGELAGRRATEEMRGILRRQFYSSRLPARIRGRATIGHKTGDWPPYLANDVGIIYAPSGAIVISAFTTENRGSYADLEAAIGRIAELIFESWSGGT
ncbi:MAG: serine hydrolase [Gemmatimonadaceae bacterium]